MGNVSFFSQCFPLSLFEFHSTKLGLGSLPDVFTLFDTD